MDAAAIDTAIARPMGAGLVVDHRAGKVAEGDPLFREHRMGHRRWNGARGSLRVVGRQIVDDLRRVRPDMYFSTDIIVGFPGETEEEFARTRELFEACNYDMAFIFKYSIRTGTPAAVLADQIPDEVKEARNAELLAIGIESSTACAGPCSCSNRRHTSSASRPIAVEYARTKARR